jgi:hypothetical protein
MKVVAELTAKVTRGPESWAYIYIFLGFALAIEGTVVSMATPLFFPWNEAVFATMFLITTYLFLFNRWFQNKLIGLKIWYEGAAR